MIGLFVKLATCVVGVVIGTIFIFASFSAQAESGFYDDPRWDFSISQPGGWRFQPSDTDEGDDIRVSMTGPNSQTNAETCNVAASDHPASRSFTQAIINTAVSHGALATIALSDLRKVDPAATLLSTKTIQLGNLKAQQSEVKSSFPGDGEAKVELISIVTAVAVPGRVYFVNCNALASKYDQLKPELDSLEQSIRIRSR
jgi:hypothetical protein